MAATGFGKDMSCTTGLRSRRTVRGLRLVAEAAFRRLITPRGSLRGGVEEANYGIDLPAMVGEVASESQLAALPGQIKLELLKDDRITAVEVEVARKDVGPEVELTITIVIFTDEGQVTLTLEVSAVAAKILGIVEG